MILKHHRQGFMNFQPVAFLPVVGQTRLGLLVELMGQLPRPSLAPSKTEGNCGESSKKTKLTTTYNKT